MPSLCDLGYLKGDFNQGDQIFPLSSRGRQCVANCLVFLLMCKIQSLYKFTRHDLNNILYNGDELYRHIKQTANVSEDFLDISDLPKAINVDAKTYSINYQNKHKSYAGNLQEENYYENQCIMCLEYAMNSCLEHSDVQRFILIFCDTAISVVKENSEYAVFDSHSRNISGMCCENGTSIISFCSSISNVCELVRRLCQSLTSTNLKNVPYILHSIVLQEQMSKCTNFTIKTIQKEHICNFEESSRTDNSTNATMINVGTCTYSSKQTGAQATDLEKMNTTSQCPKTKDVQATEINKQNPTNQCTQATEIEKFTKSVDKGPSYVCTSCNQVWFKESVVQMCISKISQDLVRKCTTGHLSVNNKEWLCLVCKKHLVEGKIPACSVGNGMRFPDTPEELKNLTEVEQRLISPRIPFMVIKEQVRGGQYSLKGNVVNVPADIDKTVRSLPRMLNDDETIHVKLKRKLSYISCVAQEMIRPNKIIKAVKYLISKPLFQREGITFNENWSMNDFNEQDSQNTNQTSNQESNQEIGDSSTSDSESTDDESNLSRRLTGNLDTLMQPIDFREFSKTLNLAPCEGNSPLGIYQDVNSEFLSFPAIYCGETRVPNNDRIVPLHYSTISKWELRHFDRRVAMSIPNMFFKLKKVQIKYLQDRIHLALRKCKLDGKKVTVEDLLSPGAVSNIVKHDEGYQILKNLRGSPAYWEAAKKDLFALIKQLGIPTWFCSLSAAETHWVSLLKCLGRLVDHSEYTDEQIKVMSWQEKCRLIKSDPVTCARFFDYRVQKFFQIILLNKDVEPLGDVSDYFYRVEFQQRGSPHIHMISWVSGAPDLSKENEDEIIDFIDKHITCTKSEELDNLLAYQTHRHARTCRKKGKSICRFHFPRPPMSRTSILQPLQESEKNIKEDLASLYEKITKKLDDYKTGSDISFADFLSELDISENLYIKAIRWSLKRPTLFLRRSLSEIRINSYNPTILKCWGANIDVQFILDAYSCAAYIVSYVSKGQRGMSNLMYETVKEARKNNFDLKQQIRAVGNKFLTHVEIGAQEAAYLLLQMPLRKSSRKVLFVNTSSPNERIILVKAFSTLEDMPSTSTDVESDNWIKRYARRPKALTNLCLADFVSWFEVSYPAKKSVKPCIDSDKDLPETLDVERSDDHHLNEEETSDEPVLDMLCNHALASEYNMADGGILKKRSRQKVLRYCKFNKDLEPFNYYRELIMLFLPWRNETTDIPSSLQQVVLLYENNKDQIQLKLSEYIKNAQVFEQVEETAENFHNDNDFDTDFMPESMHQNEQEVGQSLAEKYGCYDPSQPVTYDIGMEVGISRKQIDDENIVLNKLPEHIYRGLVASLNREQKDYFYHILKWFKTNSTPVYHFLTGGAGVGKSVVTRAIYQGLLRCLNAYPGCNPDDLKVLLCAPTGKAAHNINGNTIHATFCIPANNGFHYKPLDMQQLNAFRLKYKELKVILIDEISMVGCGMFNYINCRLQEIMGNELIFGGVSIIAIGDLYQLKPVMDNWIFTPNSNDYGPIAGNLWQDNFKIIELKVIMRQKDDSDFAELLNRVREGFQTEADIACLQSKVIVDENDTTKHVPHLFTTRREVDTFNENVYQSTNTEKSAIVSIDIVTGDINENLHRYILQKIPNDPSKTMGLHSFLQLAVNLNAEISTNVSIDDGLTNGAACTIKYFDYRIENSARCSIIWVLFDDERIGNVQRLQYKHLKTPEIDATWTPIFEITRKFTQRGRNSVYQIARRQFPLRLSAAKTIHKAQGSTLDNVVTCC